MSDILSICNLDYSYGTKEILHGVSLQISEGEICTIIGPNGCGKSTLLKAASEYSGNDCITLMNRKLTKYQRKELAKTVSVLPQSRNIPNITVKRLVEHGRFPYLDISRHLNARDNAIIDNAIETMNLTALSYSPLTKLSGGERQRAYIAMTLAQDTPLIYMDEPTTYLDINYQYELLNTIKELNINHKKTILMVLHDIGMALKYSHHIIVMSDGCIVFDGTPIELAKSDIFSQVFKINCHEVIVNDTIEYVITQACQ